MGALLTDRLQQQISLYTFAVFRNCKSSGMINLDQSAAHDGQGFIITKILEVAGMLGKPQLFDVLLPQREGFSNIKIIVRNKAFRIFPVF